MPAPKRHVRTDGANHFVVSEINPNDTCGGDCACGQHPTDQHGPFIVFQGEAKPRGGRRIPVVVCAPCAKTAVISIERGDETSVVGAGSLQDREFDGGEADAPRDYQQLKARYESTFAGTPLGEVPTLKDWLVEKGYIGNQPIAVFTGIDANASSLLQARADTSPVGTRGDRTPVGRVDDPVGQLSDPDNWGTPDDGRE